jgi:hypothetical protein
MLTIEAPTVDDGLAADETRDRLADLGGRMVTWQPHRDGTPAQAKFRFKNTARCDRFLCEALAIPGVSLSAL